MSGFRVTTTDGEKHDHPAYAVTVTQEFVGGKKEDILQAVFSSTEDREKLKNELLDLIDRITTAR